MEIGDIIKKYRSTHNLSLRAFAQKTGLSYAYISILEKGINSRTKQPTKPTLETIRCIAKGLNLSLEELLKILDNEYSNDDKVDHDSSVFETNKEKFLAMEEKLNAILRKDDAIKRLNLSFMKHIDLMEYKKSNLLAYWITDYANYHDNEKNFDYSKIVKFKRGSIIKVNLGFNVGNELGGLHYCVVISKYDSPKSGILNVIPLTSTKKAESVFSINLGNELFILLNSNIEKEEQKIFKLMNSTDFENATSSIKQAIYNELNLLQKLNVEASKLKDNSTALLSQITTISKMRIFNNETFQNIRLSNETMDKIDEGLKKLYTK